MHMPITISMNSESFPKSDMRSHLSKISHNCGAAIRRMAATETKVRNRRCTRQSYQEGRRIGAEALRFHLAGHKLQHVASTP